MQIFPIRLSRSLLPRSPSVASSSASPSKWRRSSTFMSSYFPPRLTSHPQPGVLQLVVTCWLILFFDLFLSQQDKNALHFPDPCLLKMVPLRYEHTHTHVAVTFLLKNPNPPNWKQMGKVGICAVMPELCGWWDVSVRGGGACGAQLCVAHV